MSWRLGPRWRKVASDVNAASGRLSFMMVAMAVSIAGVTAVLIAKTVLERELPRSYRDSNPASAVLLLDEVDQALVQQVRARPEILAAEASASLSARIEVAADEWMSLTISVVPDLAASRIDTVTPHVGAWPAQAGSILLERNAVSLMSIAPGGLVNIEKTRGERLSLPVAGLVYDGGKAPSYQELTIYGYVDEATFASLAPQRKLDQLKIVVRDGADSTQAIDAVVRSLAAWLRESGRTVRSIDIPAPGRHPHQWQYDTVLVVLLAFSLLGLLLEAMLMAIIVAGLLAPQIRQIAVMKAIGARTRQIAALYLVIVGGVAAGAVVVGLPLGWYAGHALVDVIAGLLNLNVLSYDVGLGLLAASAALGLMLPLIAASVPVSSAVRRTVREAIDDHGATPQSVALRAGNRLLALAARPDPLRHLAIRNTMRRGMRLLLVVSLLTTAGVLFMTGGNLLAVWNAVTADAAAERRYDLQLWLAQPADLWGLRELILKVPEVRTVEATDSMRALIDRGDHLSITSSGSNSLGLSFVEPQTTMLAFEMEAGRWLQAGDSDAIVLNSDAVRALFPGAKIGASIPLLVNGNALSLKLVGVAHQSFNRANGYTTRNMLPVVGRHPATTESVRISLPRGAAVKSSTAAVTQRLGDAGHEVRYVSTNESIARSQNAHTYVVMVLLGTIVLGVAVVGALGLATAMSSSVIGRIREFGVMRAIGGRSSHITKVIVTETVLLGVISWVLAVVLATPATAAIVNLLRAQAQMPLALAWSPLAAIAWLVTAMALSIAASIVPAKRAVALSVGEALRHIP